MPESRWEFDAGPESRDDPIHRMVSERLWRQAELVPHRGAYSAFPRKAADAWEPGALCRGRTAEGFGGDVAITGSVTVSLVGGRTSGAARSPPARPPSPPDSPSRRPRSRGLPVEGHHRRYPGGTDVRHRGHPAPGQEGEAAPVAGSSRVLDLAGSFCGIFDAITSTFRFTG